MALLTKAQILGAKDLKTEKVRVPEWGGDVFVRPMTATERDAWEAGTFADGKANLANLRARTVVLCTVDAEGNRLFGDDEVAALGAKSAAAVNRVFSRIQQINALSAADVEELGKG